MHEPKPFGLFVHGEALTERDMNFIEHCARIVTNYRTVNQLDTVKYTRELPDGGSVVIIQMNSSFRAIAYKPGEENKPVLFDGLARANIPMLFSGAIDDGWDRTNEGIEIKMTQMCQLRLGGYQGKIGGTMKLRRFRCKYTQMLQVYFVPESLRGIAEDRLLISQYDKLKSGWYSGSMAQVVQIISGFGRQDMGNLSDDPIERAEYLIPGRIYQQIKDQLKGIRLPGYTGQPDREGTIKYEFLFHSTDLVAFDAENKPWLIRVQSSGVWAMPLPIIPATRLQVFHDYVDEMGDTELQAILDRFGAIPSGETFPDAANFYRWVRAGVIIKVCDSSDFYSHSAYSTTSGWSTNSRGDHLINTCYNYNGNFAYGYTYEIGLKLGAAPDQGWSPTRQIENLSIEQMQRISGYMSQLNEALNTLEHYEKAPSIKYKMRRVDFSEILARAGGGFSTVEVDYWDDYKCDPIAEHNGQATCSREGYLFNGARLKLPEPLMGGLVSMSFAPLEIPEGGLDVPLIDTVVYAYYQGDNLKVIKNFHDERKIIKEVEGNFEDEMIIGNWEQTEYVGQTGLVGEFYSSDFDDRQEISPIEINTKLEGRDLGYSTPYATYHAFFQAMGIMSRWRCYSHKEMKTFKYDKTVAQCFLVPYGSRNGVIYGYQESYGRQRYIESATHLSAIDPNTYDIWTYDRATHWINSSREVGVKKGMPYPVDSVPVWCEVRNYNHNGSAADDFADSGDWVGPLPADVTHWVNPPNGTTSLSYGGEMPAFESYSETTDTPGKTDYQLRWGITEPTKLVNDHPHPDQYYSNSPDVYGNVLYEDACMVTFGTSQYANISIEGNRGQRFFVGHSQLCNHKYAHTFVGVINE